MSEDAAVDPENINNAEPEPVESNVVSGADVTPEKVHVKCGGCDIVYPFDIDNTVDGFVFDCSACKTRNAWTRQ